MRAIKCFVIFSLLQIQTSHSLQFDLTENLRFAAAKSFLAKNPEIIAQAQSIITSKINITQRYIQSILSNSNQIPLLANSQCSEKVQHLLTSLGHAVEALLEGDQCILGNCTTQMKDKYEEILRKNVWSLRGEPRKNLFEFY